MDNRETQARKDLEKVVSARSQRRDVEERNLRDSIIFSCKRKKKQERASCDRLFESCARDARERMEQRKKEADAHIAAYMAERKAKFEEEIAADKTNLEMLDKIREEGLAKDCARCDQEAKEAFENLPGFLEGEMLEYDRKYNWSEREEDARHALEQVKSERAALDAMRPAAKKRKL